LVGLLAELFEDMSSGSNLTSFRLFSAGSRKMESAVDEGTIDEVTTPLE